MWTWWIVSSLLTARAEPAAPPAAPAPLPVAEGEKGRASAPEFDLSRLDDPGDWHRRARVLVDGPEGCIEVQGRVRLQISLYSAGGMWSAGGRADVVAHGRLEGRLDNGVWTRLDTTWDARPEGADISLEVSRFRPVVGRLPELAYRPEDARAFREDIEGRYENPEFFGVEEEGSSPGEGSLAMTQDEDGLHLFLDVGGLPKLDAGTRAQLDLRHKIAKGVGVSCDLLVDSGQSPYEHLAENFLDIIEQAMELPVTQLCQEIRQMRMAPQTAPDTSKCLPLWK